MIEIRDIQGKVILSVPVLPESEHVEELMRTDEVHLFWNSDANTVLPDGAYVTVEGKRYSLIEPYSPAQRAENMWRYEPVFVSEFYALSKTPFFFYTYQGGNVNGTILSRETEWTLTDIPYNFMDVLCRAIFNETGKRYTFAIGSTRAASATITFSSTDIISALNAIANAFETEFWLDNSGCIHLSKAKDGASSKVLTVGKNVNVPSITEGGDGYYNQFIIFGSSRNITQDYQGANVNSIVTKRLTLDPSKYPGGYIDYSQGRSKYTKILTFDEIYPSATDLVITDVTPRFKYRLDTDTGDRIQLSGGEEAVYDMYAVYYFKLKRKVGSSYEDFKFDDSTYNASDNPNGMMLPGLVPSIHFDSGPLRGREFEIAYHKEAGKNNINDISEADLFEWEADTFSIEWVTEGDLVIPSISGLVPEDDNRVILFNVKMPSEYVSDAQGRLEAAAFEVIGERYIQLGSNGRPVTDADGNYVKVDMNSYQMSSNPVAFSEANPGLSIGSSVVYVNGDYTLETRVTALVTKLDFPVKQTITIGNDRIVGTIRELQEQAANANQDLDLLASLNDATRKILEAYERTQQAIAQNMVDHYFEKDSSNPARVNMKQEFAYLGVNSGLFFGRTNGTTPDLYIKTITEGGVAQRVLYSTLPIASESWISAKGANASGSSGESGGGGVGGSVYSRLDEWGQYNPDKADWVLSAGLGYDLYERLDRIEQGGVGGGSVSSFRLIGEGNAITDVRGDEGNTELIFNRGTTFVTVDTEQTVTGFKTFTNGIKIGKATLSWDESEEALKIDTGIYSMKWVSAKGAKSSGTSGEVGGGGVSYDRLDSWEQYDKDKSDWVLSAGLGYDLYERLAQIESGGGSGGGAGVSSFRITGSGNAITSVSANADNTELIFDRGTSFVTLDTAQTITGEKTFQNLIKIGKATVSWDEKNQALKFDTPLYSEGFVSAGGLSDTGGSAAAIVNLWQLEDVSISNPKNGQVLAYADGKWVNTTIETGGAGLDESELAAYLTQNAYLNKVTTSGSGNVVTAVTQSGQTVTVTKGITAVTSTDYESYVIKTFGFIQKRASSSLTWGTQIGSPQVYLDGPDGGGFAFRYNNPVSGQMSGIIDGYWYQQEGKYRCLDESDITNGLIGGNFVKKSGDTMTGNLNVGANDVIFSTSDDDCLIRFNDALKKFTFGRDTARGVCVGNLLVSNAYADYTNIPTYGIYVKGQIKSGVSTGTAPLSVSSTTLVSNLNADLLDGLHYTSFASKYKYITAAQHTGYYQIKINSTENWMLYFKLRVYKNYYYYDIDISGYNYGTSYWYRPAANLTSSSADSIPVYFGYDSAYHLWIAIPAGNYTGISIVDIVNGYKAVDDFDSLFTISNVSSLSGTTQTTITAYRTALTTDTVASANTLATSRKLWGQSFNGSADVSGDLTGVGSITMTGSLKVGGAVTMSSTLSVTGNITAPSINGGGAGLVIGNPGNSSYVQFQEDVQQINNNWYINNDGTASFKSLTVDNIEIYREMDIAGNIVPDSNNYYYIGSSSYRWANVYTQLLNVAGAATLGSTLSVGGNTTPSSNNSYTLGSSTYRWSNVYAVLGNFSGQITSSVATGTAPLSVASTTLVSNLNADMLDGYHETSFMRYRGEVPLSYVDITDYTAGAEDFIKSLAPGIYNVPRSGSSEIFINLAKNSGSCSALQFHTTYQASGALKFRKTIDNNRVSGAWTTILTDRNIGSYTAGKADKLSTARTIWGQSFDGSGNVDGMLTLPTSSLTGSTGLRFAGAVAHIGASSSGNIGIHAKTGIYLRPNLTDVSNGSSGISIVASTIQAEATNTFSLGTSSLRWSNIYSILGNFSGAVTMSSTLSVSGNTTVSGTLTVGSTTSGTLKIGGATLSWDNANNALKVDKIFYSTDAISAGGLSSMSSDFLPPSNNSYSLGSTTYRWSNVYTQLLNVGSTTTARDINPYSSNTYSMGTNTNYWKAVYAAAHTTVSDARLKNILSDIKIDIKDIANAPAVKFAWKDSGDTDYGTLAQYWQGINPIFVTGKDTLSVQYGKTALVSAILIARTVENHEERIKALERENAELKKQVELLKSAA